MMIARVVSKVKKILYGGYTLSEVRRESGHVFRLAFPSMLSNLTVPLMGLADMYFTGNYLPENSLAGISLGTVIFNVLFWSFGFLKMGTSGLSAIAYGAGKSTETHDILRRGLIISMALGMGMIIFSQPIIDTALSLFEAETSAKKAADIYLTSRIWSAPAVFSLFCFFGWFLGTGAPKFSLYILLLSNIINFVLDYVFVVILNMQLAGIAYATVISQYIGLLAAFYILFYSHPVFFTDFKKFITQRLFRDISTWISLFRLNLDILIRTLLLTWALSRFISLSASQGNDMLIVNTILLQVWTFTAYFLDGFAHSAENIVGTNIGNKNVKNYRLHKHLIFFWSFLTSGVFSLILFIWGIDIFKLITRFNDHAELADAYIIWLCLCPLVGNYCYIWDGIYIGSTDSAIMRNTMLVNFCLFYAMTLWWINYRNNHTLWALFLIFTLLRGLSLHISARRREKIWFSV